MDFSRALKLSLSYSYLRLESRHVRSILTRIRFCHQLSKHLNCNIHSFILLHHSLFHNLICIVIIHSQLCKHSFFSFNNCLHSCMYL